MVKIVLLTFVLSTFASAGPGQDFLTTAANHFRTYSDTTLSSIEPNTVSLEEIVARLGTPTTVATRSDKWFTNYAYEWQTTRCRLRLLAKGNTHGALRLDSIDVWGDSPDGVIGTTGHGLKLGDTMNHARLLYRTGLYRYGLPMKSSVSLEIDFDERARVNHMQLKNPCWGNLCSW
jgi:hypothetical protein